MNAVAPLPPAPDEQIERWENAGRVLRGLPEHERQKHWNMSTWGLRTDCGTIACAAGHCGMDPWFIERGFKLEFSEHSSEAKQPDVAHFFGVEGATKIFYNSATRPVEAVIDEVDAYVAHLRHVKALSASASTPRIGEHWPEQGGIFAGACLGAGASRGYFLILGPQFAGFTDWCSAVDWAAALSVDEHRDFELPNRSEGLVLFDRVRQHFQPCSYWLAPQHASNSSHAWGQNFLNGGQYYWGKNNKLRARAVRRSSI